MHLFFMTNDEADDRYGSVNIAENDSSRLAGVKLSAVITLQTECCTQDGESRYKYKYKYNEIMINKPHRLTKRDRYF